MSFRNEQYDLFLGLNVNSTALNVDFYTYAY